MKYKFGSTSQKRLSTCHPYLQKLFQNVLSVSPFDLTIIEGARSREKQQEYFDTGKSKTLNSKHLRQSDGYSHAVDVGIWRNGQIDWSDRDGYFILYGIVIAEARRLGIEIRAGADWNGNGTAADQTFDDLLHFELK